MSAKLIKNIILKLALKHQTLAVAESCTGGGLSDYLTKQPGVSQVFLGGVTTYANSAKENILHIPKAIIGKHGAVSQQVAELMAQNCLKLFSSTWALSTTGIAGPAGGTANKPVGTVWIGLAGPDILFSRH